MTDRSRLDEYRDFVSEVRQKNPLADVVGMDAKLDPAGKGMWKCSSPLRSNDWDPSFFLYPDGHYYDYGTRDHGDVFAYVMQRRSVDFRAAVDWLAERVGMKWQSATAGTAPIVVEELTKLVERLAVEEVLSEATAFYQKNMGEMIRKECRERWGLSDEMIEAAKIGWAPVGGMLSHYLVAIGFEKEQMLKSGLFFDRSGDPSDIFDGRIMFPYLVGERTRYMIGRRLDGHTPDTEWDQSKYKKQFVAGEKHPYVSKSVTNEWLYGEDWCRRKTDTLLITEGVADCVVAHQLKRACVSPVTTRFSAVQSERIIALLGTRRPRIVILNDNDENQSGIEGARAMAEGLYRAGHDVRIGEFPRPEGKDKIDLAEFLQQNGIDEFDKVVAASRGFLDFEIEGLGEGTPAGEMAARVDRISEMLVGRDPINREREVTRVARKIGIPRGLLAKKVQLASPKAETDSLTLRGQVLEDESGYYFVLGATGPEIISTFSIRPRERIVYENGKGEAIRVDFQTKAGKIFSGHVIEPSSWRSRRDFMGALVLPDLQFTGSDDNVQGIKKLVADVPVPSRRGRVVGPGSIEISPGRWLWACEDSRLLSTEGWVDPQEIQESVVVVNPGAFAGRLRHEPSDKKATAELASIVLPNLLRLNEPETMLALIGWFYATPLAPRIRTAIGHFPILWSWGTSGSGKTTTLREVMWPLLGVSRGQDPFSVTDTDYALIRTMSSSESIPGIFDEWRKDNGERNITRMLRLVRRIYGGEVEQRGRSNLTIDSYKLALPTVIAGESAPEEQAVLERLVVALFNRNALTPERALVLEKLTRLDLGALAGPYAQFVLGLDFSRELMASRQLAAGMLAGKTLPSRVADNALVVVFGLHLFEKWAESLGLNLQGIDARRAIGQIAESIVAAGDSSTTNALDHFIASCSVYAHAGELVENKHFAWIRQGSTASGLDRLCLYLPGCIEVYLAERKKTGQRDETFGIKAIRRIARESLERSGYVTDIDKVVSLSGRRCRCLEIDPEQLPEALECAEFPKGITRTWGGFRPGTGWPDGDQDN